MSHRPAQAQGPLPLRDRAHAGRLLAALLQDQPDPSDFVVLALPRGGVPVAFEIAQALQAPMDVFVVRKVGMPGQPEYAVGAIASGGVRVMDPLPPGTVRPEELLAVVDRESDELIRRELVYRGSRPAIALRGRRLLVVDDGIATGATMEAAVLALRQQHPLSIMVAAPVASTEAAQRLKPRVDALLCIATPDPFQAVSLWYDEFEQTSDEEVQELLDRSRREHAAVLHPH